MPLADVMTFYMATPLIVTALSAPLLGEKVERFRWIAVLVGFVGVLIALRPSPQMFSWAAPLALFGATTFALSQTITRELRGVHWLPLVFWQFVGSGVIGAATVPWAWTTPTAFDLGLMFLVGVVSMTCFIFIVRALALARAAVLAPLQYSAIVWAAIMGWLVWRDAPTRRSSSATPSSSAAGSTSPRGARWSGRRWSEAASCRSHPLIQCQRSGANENDVG